MKIPPPLECVNMVHLARQPSPPSLSLPARPHFPTFLVALGDSHEMLVNFIFRENLEGACIARFHNPHLNV